MDSELARATPSSTESTQKESSSDGRGNRLQFLPVNRVVSPAEAVRQRAYLSCDACRQRKTRCVPSTPRQRQPCQRCVSDGRECQFRSTRAVVTRRRPGRRPSRDSSGSPQCPANDVLPINALLAGDTSVERTGDVIQGGSQHQEDSLQLEGHPPLGPFGNSPGFQATDNNMETHRRSASTAPPMSSIGAQSTARGRIISTRLHDTADALDLLTLTAAGVQRDASQASAHGDAALSQPREPPLHSAQPSGKTWPRLTGDTDWRKFVLVRKGVATKAEVVEYLDFYFAVLWPLRPIIHLVYRDRARYTLLAAEEPLLLICLVTLASRYHSLSGAHGEIRSERIHWQAWSLLQKYFQSALWGSPVTRSPGAIVAMLLMIEWHSKAINNPPGLSDSDDYELLGVLGSAEGHLENSPDALSSATDQQRCEMKTLLEKLNIVAPAYRSNKMSWMLLSNAIALAQEGGCFDRDLRPSQGTLSTYETFKNEWNQLICVFIYLADESLSVRLGLDTLSPAKCTDAVRTRFSSSFASLLPESALWESYYELTLAARRAREVLQSLKRAGPAVAAGAVLPELEHIGRGLDRWKRQQVYVSPNEQSLPRACVELEYQYLIMYSFAPASHIISLGDNSPKDPGKKPAEGRAPGSLLALANRATSASREILNTLVNVLEPSAMLKYVPVRCWQFVVAANLHLLKITDAPATESSDDLALLRLSISAMRGGSPDDTHMAVRYAQFLEILLDASGAPAGPGATEPAHPRSSLGPTNGEGLGDVMPFMTPLDDFDLPDIVSGLGNIGELIDWSDGPYGAFNVMGLL